MYKESLTICPICKEKLERPVTEGSVDELIFICPHCGKYAMSLEFYEDHIEYPNFIRNKKGIALFLCVHRNNGTPLCLCNFDSTTSEKYRCVTTEVIDKWYASVLRKKPRYCAAFYLLY